MTIDCGAYNQNCVLHELEGHRCLPIESCEATCIGKNCGDNGCGGFCGTCQTGEVCEDGLCSSVGAIPSDVEGSPDTWASLEQDTSTEAPAPPDDSSGCQAPASGPLNGLLLMALGAFIAWRRRHPEVQSR
jgi:MYXO-CTERM domain-containing protein